MNGKEDIPNITRTEDDTFKALKRKSFHELMHNMNICWLDDGVISILKDTDDWEKLADYIHDSGWTRAEFVEECIKRKDAREYTYYQYIKRLGLI